MLRLIGTPSRYLGFTELIPTVFHAVSVYFRERKLCNNFCTSDAIEVHKFRKVSRWDMGDINYLGRNELYPG